MLEHFLRAISLLTVSSRQDRSRSSTTIVAQKLAAEVDVLQRRVERERKLAHLEAERERELALLEVERERKLARLEEEAEQSQLAAKLAALEAKAKSCNSYHSSRHSEKRTARWVAEQDATMTLVAPVNVSGKAPSVTLDNSRGTLQQSSVPAYSVQLHASNVKHADRPTPTPNTTSPQML
ncbi:unnamed protein product [Chilo suppressalis]|uniref:Uncharacterized protein n=1 Tax=Chilo suppressalis TaxID=168631 RepID=A0ABN8ATE2_CHISP|nr:unnamed protein product [Chilo suppressalis]